MTHAPSYLPGPVRWLHLRAVVQAQAFETPATHYPVYFERANGRPLERGEDRCLAMHWPLQLDGWQRLVSGFEGDGKGHLLFSGAGLWYADPAGGRFGRVEGNPALPGQLARAPALPPEQVAAFRKRTAERKPALVLPEPIEPPPLRVTEQAPVPVLHLTIQALPPLRHGYKRWPAQTVGIALLTFDYEGVRIAPDIPFPASDAWSRAANGAPRSTKTAAPGSTCCGTTSTPTKCRT